MTMKTFLSVGIGLVAGIMIGIAASFKAATEKAGKIIEEELAETRKAQRGEIVSDGCQKHNYTEECTDFTETEDDSESPFDIPSDVKEQYDEISSQYEPAKKPYILDDSADFYKERPYLNDFTEVCVVYDREKGRVADEDGCEIFDIKGCLGFNNLNKLNTNDAEFISIVCERDGMIYHAHLGTIYEYMDREDDFIYG